MQETWLMASIGGRSSRQISGVAEGVVLPDLEDVVELRDLVGAERRRGLRGRGLGDHRRVAGAVFVVGIGRAGERSERQGEGGDPSERSEARGGKHGEVLP